MTFTRRHLLAAAALAPLGLPAFAQAWPARPIRLISPYGAGGPSDVTEYFLIGSFASWLLALGGVALCAW